jgi:hypothetical protein
MAIFVTDRDIAAIFCLLAFATSKLAAARISVDYPRF